MLKCRFRQPWLQRRDCFNNRFQCMVCKRVKCFCRCKKRSRIVSLIRLAPTSISSFFVGYFLSALVFEMLDSLVEKLTGMSFSDSFILCKEEGNYGFGVSFFSLLQAIFEDKLGLTLLLVAGLMVKDAALIRFIDMTQIAQSFAAEKSACENELLRCAKNPCQIKNLPEIQKCKNQNVNCKNKPARNPGSKKIQIFCPKKARPCQKIVENVKRFCQPFYCPNDTYAGQMADCPREPPLPAHTSTYFRPATACNQTLFVPRRYRGCCCCYHEPCVVDYRPPLTRNQCRPPSHKCCLPNCDVEEDSDVYECNCWHRGPRYSQSGCGCCYTECRQPKWRRESYPIPCANPRKNFEDVQEEAEYQPTYPPFNDSGEEDSPIVVDDCDDYVTASPIHDAGDSRFANQHQEKRSPQNHRPRNRRRKR